MSHRHVQAVRGPQFIDKVRDVVGVYLNPPDKAVVICVDEKTGIQALDRPRHRAVEFRMFLDNLQRYLTNL